MKALMIASALLVFIPTTAQVNFGKPGVFVRVFDLQGKKIGKGRITLLTDNNVTLQAKRENGPTLIQMSEIGYIRTHRSGGHNLLIGAAAGAGAFAMIGVATADPDEFLGYSAAEGALAGAVIGGTAGSVIGALTILFKKSENHTIDGNADKWHAFVSSMTH